MRTYHTFRTRSGGRVRNIMNIPVVHETTEYHTVGRHQWPARAASLMVECRDTGTLDADRRAIYETPDGTVFVYEYHSGGPDHFDLGRIVAPNLGTK